LCPKSDSLIPNQEKGTVDKTAFSTDFVPRGAGPNRFSEGTKQLFFFFKFSFVPHGTG